MRETWLLKYRDHFTTLVLNDNTYMKYKGIKQPP